MLLAVIMAVRNNQNTLSEAVGSILNQTFKDFTLIVVDDHSTDSSPEILRSFVDPRLKIITNSKHLGLTKSLNLALSATNAKYIARMDADDISLPDRLKLQIEYLDKHPQVVLLGTAAHLIDNQGKTIGLKRYPSDHAALHRRIIAFCPFIHPTWMFNRIAVKQLGDYNPHFTYAQDYELALRITAKHQVANLPQPLIYYRVNSPDAISIKHLKLQEKLALQARFLALIRYGYSPAEWIKTIKPLLSFLLPAKLKLKLYRNFFWD